MSFSFKPRTPTEQDDFDIYFKNELIDTFFWKRNHPKPTDKVAIVRDFNENVAIVPDERSACVKIALWNNLS